MYRTVWEAKATPNGENHEDPDSSEADLLEVHGESREQRIEM